MGKTESALGGGGRRAREELGIPVADGDTHGKDGRGSADLNENNYGGRGCDRRRGVHGDAERAVVCSGFSGVDVRYLNYGQEREQDQTQHSHDRQSA